MNRFFMNIEIKCLSFVAISVFSLVFASFAGAESRPNIVWIFSDDHTRQAIGAYGGLLAKVNPTPNIDRLAKEGVRFDRCYVGNSICAPSRATLLTGKRVISTESLIIMVPLIITSSSFKRSCSSMAMRRR